MTLKSFLQEKGLEFGKGKSAELCEAKSKCYTDFNTKEVTTEKMCYLYFSKNTEYAGVEDIQVMVLSRTAAAKVRSNEVKLGACELAIDDDRVYIQMPATRNVLDISLD